MHPMITYVLLALCGAAFLLGFFIDMLRVPVLVRLRRYSTMMLIAAMVGAYAVLVPGRGVDGRAALQASAASQQPLFMEFFSNR